MREKSSQSWRDSFTPGSCPGAEKLLVMGIAEGSPVLGEVEEADVGKALCQHLWDRAVGGEYRNILEIQDWRRLSSKF